MLEFIWRIAFFIVPVQLFTGYISLSNDFRSIRSSYHQLRAERCYIIAFANTMESSNANSNDNRYNYCLNSWCVEINCHFEGYMGNVIYEMCTGWMQFFSQFNNLNVFEMIKENRKFENSLLEAYSKRHYSSWRHSFFGLEVKPQFSNNNVFLTISVRHAIEYLYQYLKDLVILYKKQTVFRIWVMSWFATKNLTFRPNYKGFLQEETLNFSTKPETKYPHWTVKAR